GFVQRATMSARTFLQHGAELVRSTPLDWLRLTGASGSLKKVLVHPALARVPQFSLADNRLGHRGYRLLADAPVLAGMKGLYLGSSDFDRDAAAMLAGSPYLTNITILNLCWTPIWDGMMELAASPHLKSLESLSILGAGVAAAQLRSVADAPYWDR